jgi:hypothetical protein
MPKCVKNTCRRFKKHTKIHSEYLGPLLEGWSGRSTGRANLKKQVTVNAGIRQKGEFL